MRKGGAFTRAWKRWLGYVVAAIVAGFAFLGAIGLGIDLPGPTANGQDQPLGGVPAPAFQLTDPEGHPWSLSDAQGRPVVLAFYDPLCQGICPPIPAILGAAQRQLGPTTARQVSWVMVDTNPLPRPIPPVLVQSLPARFLSGPLPVRYAVWQAYHIDVALEGGRVAYTAAIYVIDGAGRERYLLPVATDQAPAARAAVLVRDLRPLL
ncbi:MAG: redoxin domain-containing protein [Firmicutes bacterium]|nr:redoxin domain-containing protein [Alicyclobacillaceae bacterium]MCL6497089.1 redoxin domain-containing protein [Bacillota bacterium]